MNEQCSTCKFFHNEVNAFYHLYDKNKSECRRFPPVVASLYWYTGDNKHRNYDTMFPIVNPTDWCGEYKSEENKNE